MTIGLIRIFGQHQPEIFALAPISFILTIFVLNSISQKLNSRDFHLIIRGDTLKTSVFDQVASIVALVLPFLISFIIPFKFLTN